MTINPPPPAKRARTAAPRGDDDYKPGSILEIEVHNFMTYSHIKSKPGPRLNLVIGPNGTGKSSLVCAIGIGLAGEPQILGRASQIRDFVKRGEDSGWIKITLRGDSPNESLVIKRKINNRNKSEWFFNDQQVTKKEIQEQVRKFNIQLDNLTQFLPQDRVCEFAKLTPVQLLEETEKAVGNPELSAQHQRLIQSNEEMKKIRVALASHESTLAHVETSNAELEQDKERLEQRTQLLENAGTMKKKVPWMRYEEKKASFEKAEEAERVAKSKLQNLQEQNRQTREIFEPLRVRKDEAAVASTGLKDLKTKSEQNLRKVGDKETEFSAKVRTKLGEIQEVHRKESIRQERIEKARKDALDAEEALKNLPECRPREEILAGLKSRIKDLQLDGGDKDTQIREKEALLSHRRRDRDQINHRLQDINSVNTRLLQALKNSGAYQISNAVEWVQCHRDQFKEEVFGPVLLEVRIANKEHAKYVEGQVPNHIWKAFVTQNNEDRDLLVKNLKQFEVPVINQRMGQFRHPPREVTPAMMQLGITTRLDEVIEAHAVVKMLLIGQSGLDNSFIGTSETNQIADEAPRLGVKDLWTPQNHYRWQESRYGGHVSASVTSVRQVRLFSENVDQKEKNELQSRLTQVQNEMSQIEAAIREIREQGKAIIEEIQKLDRQQDEIFNEARLQRKKQTDAKNLIEQRRRRLVMLENEEGSADAESRLRALVKKTNAERVENLMLLKDLLTESGEIHMRYAAQHLHAIELDARVKEKESNLQKQFSELRAAEAQWSQCKEVTYNCRTIVARAKAHADEEASMTPELQQKFAEMPDSIPELEEAIRDYEEEAKGVICNNENAIMIYEARCEQIRNLKAKADEKRDALDGCMKEIERVQNVWLPELRELVSKINDTFSENFREMAVAGEVSLDEQGTDFDKYGVLIKVKFRESGNLQVLSAHHQSGGERSVSTILYLVSLQDLTNCPFRVVDEINQGMDPKNERKMFQQLVRAASKSNTPQCLLLTPKLLPDLEYTEACTILNIMNGPWIDEASSSGWKDGVPWSVMSQLVRSQ
ncbi:unnamed protein product [Calypogeia fissa]